MGFIEDSINDFVFKKTDIWNFTEVVLNGTDLAVLTEIDGKTTLGLISNKLDILQNDLKEAVNRLVMNKLIQIVDIRREQSLPIISVADTDYATTKNEISARSKYRVYRGISYRVS